MPTAASRKETCLRSFPAHANKPLFKVTGGGGVMSHATLYGSTAALSYPNAGSGAALVPLQSMSSAPTLAPQHPARTRPSSHAGQHDVVLFWPFLCSASPNTVGDAAHAPQQSLLVPIKSWWMGRMIRNLSQLLPLKSTVTFPWVCGCLTGCFMGSWAQFFSLPRRNYSAR